MNKSIEEKNNPTLHRETKFYDNNGVCFNKNNEVLARYPDGVHYEIIEVPEFVKEINTWGFKGLSVSEIIFHDRIKILKDFMFEGCRNLKTITFKSSSPGNIQIDKNAFNRFDIEDCVLRVPINAMADYKIDGRFDEFKYITAIEGSRCLKYNEEGTEVVGCIKDNCGNIIIPESVKHIKEKAFENNEKITNVYFPESLISIGNKAFTGCYGISKIRLNNNLEYIGLDAFRGTSLKRVKIPYNVNEIGKSAFNCEMQVSSLNKNYKDINGVLFNSNKTRLLIFPSLKDDKHYDVPNGTLEIEQFAFEDSCLWSISFPESIKKLGANMFNGCTFLMKLSFNSEDPEDIEIDKEAFNGFEQKLCTIFVPYYDYSILNYYSHNMFDGFFAIKEMAYQIGDKFLNLPDTILIESKPFCAYGGKFKCKAVLTSSGFFIKMLDGSYYYLSDLVNDDQTGNIWIQYQKDNKRSFDIIYSSDNYPSISFGKFTESLSRGELLYQDYKSGKTFIIDLKTRKKK